MSESQFEPGKLLDGSIEKLLAWSVNLDGIRQEFIDAGFRVPQLHLAYLESIRNRTKFEISYDQYLNEIWKESPRLPRGSWYVDARNLLPLNHRSVYLEYLQKEFDTGAFKTSKEIHASLDPNRVLNSEMMISRPPVYLQHFEDLREEKRAEVSIFHEKIQAFSPPKSRAITFDNVAKTILNIADDLRLECFLVEKGRKARVVLRAEILQDISMYLHWNELSAVRENGNLHVHFQIQESNRLLPTGDDWRSPPCVKALDDIVPGGRYYSSLNPDWDHVVLGLFANAKFLSICAKRNT